MGDQTPKPPPIDEESFFYCLANRVSRYTSRRKALNSVRKFRSIASQTDISEVVKNADFSFLKGVPHHSTSTLEECAKKEDVSKKVTKHPEHCPVGASTSKVIERDTHRHSSCEPASKDDLTKKDKYVNLADFSEDSDTYTPAATTGHLVTLRKKSLSLKKQSAESSSSQPHAEEEKKNKKHKEEALLSTVQGNHEKPKRTVCSSDSHAEDESSASSPDTRESHAPLKKQKAAKLISSLLQSEGKRQMRKGNKNPIYMDFTEDEDASSEDKKKKKTSGKAKNAHLEQEIQEPARCHKCQDVLPKVLGQLKCGHIFCVKCAEKISSKSKICPKCNKRVKVYHKIEI